MATRNTLTTDVWDSVYTYLQTTNAITTNNIFSAFNDTLVKNKGYPLVIIYPPEVDFIPEDIQGEMTSSSTSMLIEVYDDNSQDTKAMRDEVTSKLLAGRSTFRTAKLYKMKIENSGYDTWQEGGKKIHRLALMVEFTYRGKA